MGHRDQAPPPADQGRRVLRLTLDVQEGVEPLSGVLRGNGIEQPFQGWLSLASALERAVRPL